MRLRLLLETSAWIAAAERATPANLMVLNKALEATASAVATQSYDEIAQAGLEFHRAIWRMSGDSTMMKILNQVTAPQFAFVSARRSLRRDSLSHMIASHQAIIDLLLRATPEVKVNLRHFSHRHAAEETRGNSGFRTWPTRAHSAISSRPDNWMSPNAKPRRRPSSASAARSM